MALTEGSNDGAMNGATPVTVVSAPSASTRRLVRSITIQNRDTAAVTVTLRYVSSGGTRQIWSGTLQVGETFLITATLVLDDTGKSITAVMSGGPATTNPDYTAHYADATS